MGMLSSQKCPEDRYGLGQPINRTYYGKVDIRLKAEENHNIFFTITKIIRSISEVTWYDGQLSSLSNFYHNQIAAKRRVNSYIEPERQYIVHEVPLLAISLQNLLRHRLWLAMVYGENQVCFLKPAEYKNNNESEMIEYRIAFGCLKEVTN